MRLFYLDSIRGLAAFIVVLNHCYLALPEAVAKHYIVPFIKWTPLRVIMVGRAAVIIFFVLSGLALGLSLLKSQNSSHKDFIIRRICRIYPTYIAAILFSCLLFFLTQPQIITDLTPWFNKNWRDGAGVDVVLGHMLMLNRTSDVSLNSVVWSLAFEMRISLIFPLLMFLARGLGTKSYLALSLGFTVLVEILLRYLGIESGAYHNANALEALLTTAHYILFFSAGLLMAIHLERVKAIFSSLRWYAALALWLVAGATLTQYSDFICGFGAVLIIGLVLGSPRIQAGLDFFPIAWLGKVSYSLYLFHLPILLMAVHLGYGVMPIWAYMLPAVLVSLLVAGLAYRYIEAPSIELGRSLTRRQDALKPAISS